MKPTYSRRKVLQLGLGALSVAGCERIPGNITRTPALKTAALEGYKALVCVFLRGGNDGYNLLVPATPEKYQSYAAARQNLAVPREQLLALPGAAADGADYGLHGSCPELHQLYAQGRTAILSNTGSLAFPASKADYDRGSRVPRHLFSHNDQQDQWQTAQADRVNTSGWAGRIADVLAHAKGDSVMPLNLSLNGSNLLQTGQRALAFAISPHGAIRLDNLEAAGATADLRAAFDRVRGVPARHLLERSYASSLNSGIELNALLDQVLSGASPLVTEFAADNPLAQQLQMVARIIGVRERLRLKRQIFFVEMSGFDTHNGQNTYQPQLFQKLSQALAAFYRATEELGVAAQVTSFTLSDFGRSLSINSDGTDHGWSSHHLITGGAVNGGRIYGMPPSLIPGGVDDSVGGRFIPSTAVDEYGSTLARWLGVGEGDLEYVFPNLGRFATRGLDFL